MGYRVADHGSRRRRSVTEPQREPTERCSSPPVTLNRQDVANPRTHRVRPVLGGATVGAQQRYRIGSIPLAAISEAADGLLRKSTKAFAPARSFAADVTAWGAATDVTPKFVAASDPAAQWTGALRNAAFFAYADNYLIDVDFGIIVDVEASRAIRQSEGCVGCRHAAANRSR